MKVNDANGKSLLTAISVEGFKSFAKKQRVEIGPLTLLAGANSSGKSSLVQPLLLLKQTLEAGYDPGPLLLDGPHVRFSSADQLLARHAGHAASEFRIGFESDDNSILEEFRGTENHGFELVQSNFKIRGRDIVLRANIKNLQTPAVESLAPTLFGPTARQFFEDKVRWEVVRRGCFLTVAMMGDNNEWAVSLPEEIFGGMLRRIIHIPGLRGNPERSYNTSAVGKLFPGVFGNYVASIIVAWQESSDKRLDVLGQALQLLGLTWRIEANPLDATRVELLVARLPTKPKSGRGDLVNVADVGFGVSQVLPVLVALLTAEPGQLVYIEQPELHLHPRAQQALAAILANAANRGVQVVAETHSSILLLAVQTLVVEGKLSPEKVKLHWFQRDSRGATQVTSGDLDHLGAYGDWPVDFDEVEAKADNAYLDAVETRAFPAKKKNARR
jgi:predicted ATPase